MPGSLNSPLRLPTSHCHRPHARQDGTEVFTRDCAAQNTNAAQQWAKEQTGRREKALCQLKKQIAGDELSQQVAHCNSERDPTGTSSGDREGSSRKTSSRFLLLIKARPLLVVSRSEIVALYYSLLASNYVSQADVKKSDPSRSLL